MEFPKEFAGFFAGIMGTFSGLLVYFLYVLNPLLGYVVTLILALLVVFAFIFAVILHFEVDLKIDIRDKKQREKFLYEWWHGKRKRLVSKRAYVNSFSETWIEINPSKSAVRKFTQLKLEEKLVCEGCRDQENCQLIGKVFIVGVGYDPKDYRKKLWVANVLNQGIVFTCDKPCFARSIFPVMSVKIPMPHLRIFEQGDQDASSNV